MVDKVVVYNIALNVLLIDYQTIDPDNDKHKALKSLNIMYPLALSKVLADLDLNKTATKVKLELTTYSHPHWQFVYKYPSNSAKFRRVLSQFAQDNKLTRVPFATETMDGIAVICTNDSEAWGEIQPTGLNLSVLNPNAGLAVGYMMAYLASALIAGKGSSQLKKSILQEYTMHKAEAMEDDQNENVDTSTDERNSEFVSAALGGGYKWPTRT